MKYYLGYYLDGDAGNYYLEIVNRVAAQFGDFHVKRDRIPHITFKAPFKRDSINDLETFLESFCAKSHPQKFEIGGFGSLNNQVVFWDIRPSLGFINTYLGLLDGLKSLENISFSEYDDVGKKFHITITNGSAINIQRAMEFLSPFQACFERRLDRLTLFQKQEGRTVIYRDYPLL